MKTKTLLSALLITLMSINISAQIVYTDIADGVPTGIDFNSDGTMEFDITTMMSSGDYIVYSSYGANNNIHAIGTASTQNWDVPNCESAGFTVDASNQWEGQGDCSINGWGVGNNTITFNQDEYLCVRFNISGTNVYYGWIRFSMNSSGVITYKDYAYNSTAGQSISTGDIGTGINKSDKSKHISIYPNPAQKTITIINSYQSGISNITISDILGNKVLALSLSAYQKTIDISNLKSGVYIVSIFSENKLEVVKKLIVK